MQIREFSRLFQLLQRFRIQKKTGRCNEYRWHWPIMRHKKQTVRKILWYVRSTIDDEQKFRYRI